MTSKAKPSDKDGNRGEALSTSLEVRFAQSQLSRSRRQLIRAILDSHEEAFFLSSREMARRYNVDAATLVRTIQALGYERFADFAADQAGIARSLPHGFGMDFQPVRLGHGPHHLDHEAGPTLRGAPVLVGPLVGAGREDDAARLRDHGMLLRRTVQFHWRNDGYADFEDFLRRLTHARRKNIRQERAKVVRAGVTMRMPCTRFTARTT